MYGVYDKTSSTRRTRILLGAVGTNKDLEDLSIFLEKMKFPIKGMGDDRKINLFPDFCGFNENIGFNADLIFNQRELGRPIKHLDIEKNTKIKNRSQRIEEIINIFYEEIKFLAQNRSVDVIICVLSKSIFDAVSAESTVEDDPKLEDSIEDQTELNFRRALKAKAMHLGKPLQLLRADSLISGGKNQQDDATKAWNLATALYYKSGATNPWRLQSTKENTQSCALGIAFYRSRDKKTLNTSLAQVFDELGNGLILRGTPVHLEKGDRVPQLSEEQSYILFKAALEEYRNAMKAYPRRVVVHKTSNFSDPEMSGFMSAASCLRIDTVDFVTVMDSHFRLFRKGGYPPFRGTSLALSEQRQLLYTRGSIWYYKTYPGMYIPQPLEIRTVRSEQSPAFYGKYPITLGCARKVGEIMKYLDDHAHPQIRYGYYM